MGLICGIRRGIATVRLTKMPPLIRRGNDQIRSIDQSRPEANFHVMSREGAEHSGYVALVLKKRLHDRKPPSRTESAAVRGVEESE